MDQRFLYALVAVDELRVLADHGDAHAHSGRDDALHHGAPGRQVRLRRLEIQTLHDAAVHPLFVERERDLVDRGDVATLDHRAKLHIAEQRDLSLGILRQRTLGAADENVGLTNT